MSVQGVLNSYASESFISDITDKILPQIEEWQIRPLDDVYPVVYIDAIHYSVRSDGIIRKLAAYVILGINCEGKKDVLTIEVGENESAKYWLAVLNGLKNRGVKDILIICADGLSGIREAIQTAFPKTEYQRCIVPQVRDTLKYVADKDRKAFAKDSGRFTDVLKKYTNPTLLILDEWLLLKLSEADAPNLLELIHKRRKHSSTIFCSQFREEGWYNKLGGKDSPLSDAIMNRISYDSYKIVIESINPDKDISMREVYGLDPKLAQ